MLTFLSKMTIKPEKEEEFLALVAELTAEVRAKEPNTLAYQFYKLRDDRYGYAVFESFPDQAAEDEHQATEHFARLAPPMIECLDGPYIREYLDDIE